MDYMDIMNGKTSPYPKGSINNAFWDFLVDMRTPSENSNNNVLNPKALFGLICNKIGRFRGFH